MPKKRHKPEEIVAKLRFVAGTDDHGVYCRLVHDPVQGHLGGRHAARGRNLRQLVDDAVHAFEVDGAGNVQFIQTAD